MTDPLTQDNVLDKASREYLGQINAAEKQLSERSALYKQPPLRPFGKLDALRGAGGHTLKTKDGLTQHTFQDLNEPRDEKRLQHYTKAFDRWNKFFYPGYKQGIRRDPSLMYGPGWDPTDPHRYTPYGFNPWGSKVEGFPRPNQPPEDYWGHQPFPRHKWELGQYEVNKQEAEEVDSSSIIDAIRTLHRAGVLKLSEEATEPSERAAARELEELEKEQESGKPIEYKPEGSVIPPKVKKKVSDMEKENQRRRQEALN